MNKQGVKRFIHRKENDFIVKRIIFEGPLCVASGDKKIFLFWKQKNRINYRMLFEAHRDGMAEISTESLNFYKSRVFDNIYLLDIRNYPNEDYSYDSLRIEFADNTLIKVSTQREVFEEEVEVAIKKLPIEKGELIEKKIEINQQGTLKIATVVTRNGNRWYLSALIYGPFSFREPGESHSHSKYYKAFRDVYCDEYSIRAIRFDFETLRIIVTVQNPDLSYSDRKFRMAWI